MRLLATPDGARFFLVPEGELPAGELVLQTVERAGLHLDAAWAARWEVPVEVGVAWGDWQARLLERAFARLRREELDPLGARLAVALASVRARIEDEAAKIGLGDPERLARGWGVAGDVASLAAATHALLELVPGLLEGSVDPAEVRWRLESVFGGAPGEVEAGVERVLTTLRVDARQPELASALRRALGSA